MKEKPNGQGSLIEDLQQLRASLAQSVEDHSDTEDLVSQLEPFRHERGINAYFACEAQEHMISQQACLELALCNVEKLIKRHCGQ